jgi:hypothetical protein
VKRLVQNIVKRWMRLAVRFVALEARDWENLQLILPAKAIMTSSSWRETELPLSLAQKEFRVYSQWGDDGIIQFLVHALQLQSESFIEFGVADFYESNTHFLLVNNNWRGFVIDGSPDNIHALKKSPLYWRYSLQAEASFVTAENINELLSRSGFGKIGLLHIDLDGNDYWILKALDLSIYQPDILILEYNAHFGIDRAISVPYDPTFHRMNAHYSGQFFGASLPALNKLAEEKGYYFIGCNSAGNNAYFLRNVYRTTIPPVDLRHGFVEARFRDARDADGNLMYWPPGSCQKAIRGLTVINVENGHPELF